MIRTEELHDLLANGGTVTGSDGSKIGKMGQVFLDDETGEPEWVTVKTGMFGGAESFVPLSQATVSGDEIQVPFDKDMVKDAPRVDDSDGHLSPEEETELFRYYGVSDSSGTDYTNTSTGQVPVSSDGGQRVDDDRDRTVGRDGGDVGHDTSGQNTDQAMTRSEEQLNVGTEQVSGGKVRLRKYIVTENVTKTVPVSHEEVRIEREPITDENRGDALAGGELTDEEHEVELKAERVVVDKDVVPVERVRLDTETVTEDQQVTEEVRKEQIDSEGDLTDTAERDR